MDAVVCLVTTPPDQARPIAEALVARELVACVNILAHVQSVYRWKGAVHREPEFLLLAKTTSACFDELEREVRALHTYDNPEIVALPVSHVSASYLDWIISNAFPPLVSRVAADENPAPPPAPEDQ